MEGKRSLELTLGIQLDHPPRWWDQAVFKGFDDLQDGREAACSFAVTDIGFHLRFCG